MPRALVTLAAAAATATAVLVVTSSPAPVPAAHAVRPVVLETHVEEAQIGEQDRVWSAADHDGVALSSDAPDLDDLPKVHGVYLHPSDRPSVFAEYAAMFQSEHDRASDFLTDATGMAFRWDKRKAADGRLLDDITVVRSKYTYAQLTGNRHWSLIGNSLEAAGLTDPDKKYYVWLDAAGDVCGRGQALYDPARSAANPANGSTYAVSYRIGSPYEHLGGWCNPVLHELMHGMGAVASHMPNYYGGGHCDDDANDVMCRIDVSPGGAIDREKPRTLDGGIDGIGNDDYLDPAADLQDLTGRTLPWWTVNLSRFLCPRSANDRTVPDCSVPNDPFGVEAEPTPSPSPSESPRPRGNKK